MTNTKSQKFFIVGVLFLALAIGASFSGAAQASTSDMQISATAKQSVQCFALARAQRLNVDILELYIKRIGKASGTAGAVFWLGYTEGTLDAYGYAHASKFPSAQAARLDAATQLYKLMGCTINVKI